MIFSKTKRHARNSITALLVLPSSLRKILNLLEIFENDKLLPEGEQQLSDFSTQLLSISRLSLSIYLSYLPHYLLSIYNLILSVPILLLIILFITPGFPVLFFKFLLLLLFVQYLPTYHPNLSNIIVFLLMFFLFPILSFLSTLQIRGGLGISSRGWQRYLQEVAKISQGVAKQIARYLLSPRSVFRFPTQHY